MLRRRSFARHSYRKTPSVSTSSGAPPWLLRPTPWTSARVHRLLESWRRVARLTVGLGHDGYRRMLSEADHRLRTGEMPDNPVPLDEVRLHLAERIAAGPR